MFTNKANNMTCKCNESWCRKCLSVACCDDDCKTHRLYKKIEAREGILGEQSVKDEKMQKELNRLKLVYKSKNQI